MEPRQDPKRMKKLLSQRDRRGWSWAELSRRSGLAVWKLHFWRRRLSAKRPTRRSRRGFVAVEVVASPPVRCPPLEVITPSGVRILVSGDFNDEHLKRVIKAVTPGC